MTAAVVAAAAVERTAKTVAVTYRQQSSKRDGQSTINNQLKETQQSARTTIKTPSGNRDRDGNAGYSDGDGFCICDGGWQPSGGWQTSGGSWQQKWWRIIMM